jgi:glycosyltransferase involved in cell wall biosynthesis
MASWTGHGSKWAWWCIYDILEGLGHRITLSDWRLDPPGKNYDAVFCIQHLMGLDEAVNDDTIQMVRLTMADPFYHNKIVNERTEAVNKRRGTHFEPMRLLNMDHNHYWSIEQANAVFLNGNEWTKSTYPAEYHDKIKTVDNAAGNINRKVEMRTEIPKARHWLWHAGSGAIHKGLDLCLEAFAKHPEWTLHITGNLRNEPEFLAEYNRELNLPNIQYHGWLLVDSPKFQSIVDQCVGFILPTCSEGQSPAAATCLTLGLYPIISRQSGIDLPEEDEIPYAGVYLRELTVREVETKVALVMDLADEILLDDIRACQSDAMTRYSREAFRDRMTGLLKEALCVN